MSRIVDICIHKDWLENCKENDHQIILDYNKQMKMNLYELSNEIMSIASLEEITDEDIQNFDKLEISFDSKLEGLIKFYKNLNAEADKFDEEAKRLSQVKKSLSNKAERIKSYIDSCLKIQQTQEKQVGLFKLSYRSSKAVEVADIDKIPAEYTKVDVTADKMAIKAAIESGVEVPGATIVTNLNLQIK